MIPLTPEQILDRVIVGVQVYLADGTVAYSNPAADRLLHREQADIEERGLYGNWQVVDTANEPMRNEDFPASRALATGQEVEGIIGVSEAGEITWLSILAAPVHDAGKVAAVVVSFLDVTEQQRLAKMKEQFIQNVSHELRTPLSPIYGYSSMLRDGLLGDMTAEQTRVVGVIFHHANDMRYMINQQIAMVQSYVTPRRAFFKLDAAKMVAEIIKDTELLARHEHGITVKRGTIGRRLIILGDILRLRLAIINVIENALKFTSADGVITVSCKRNNGEAVIIVADTGIGIAAKEHGRIFEPFYQVNGATDRKYGGMGLGLAVAKIVFVAHDGRIEVESEIGKGSTFRIHLPLHSDK